MKASPSAPAASPNNTVSDSSSRAMRPRLAPSAARIASSCWRPSARTRKRFATFAHAMSSTTPTAAEQNPEDPPDVPGHVFAQWSNVRPQLEPFVAFLEKRDHPRDVGVRLRQRDAGLQPRHGLEVEHHEIARRSSCIGSTSVRIGAQEPEGRGQHADDLARLAIDLSGLSDDVLGAAEPALPVAVGQDHPQRAARRVVLLAEQAATSRLHPQQRQRGVR